MHSANIEALRVTHGNFAWWYNFSMTMFYLGILGTMVDIYFGVDVHLVSMFVVSDFWRAPS